VVVVGVADSVVVEAAAAPAGRIQCRDLERGCSEAPPLLLLLEGREPRGAGPRRAAVVLVIAVL
jgi:hypothetical protein